jgi:hypothetical protein
MEGDIMKIPGFGIRFPFLVFGYRYFSTNNGWYNIIPDPRTPFSAWWEVSK